LQSQLQYIFQCAVLIADVTIFYLLDVFWVSHPPVQRGGNDHPLQASLSPATQLTTWAPACKHAFLVAFSSRIRATITSQTDTAIHTSGVALHSQTHSMLLPATGKGTYPEAIQVDAVPSETQKSESTIALGPPGRVFSTFRRNTTSRGGGFSGPGVVDRVDRPFGF
jgi:hypothetical protein